MTVITARDVKECISSILNRYSPKKIAASIKGSESSVQNWRRQSSEPSAHQLIRLMREYDDVYEAVVSMAGRNPANSPLSKSQTEIVHEALAIIGTAIPTASPNPPRISKPSHHSQKIKRLSCHQSHFHLPEGFKDIAPPKTRKMVTS